MATIKSRVKKYLKEGLTNREIVDKSNLSIRQIRSTISKYGWSSNRYPKISKDKNSDIWQIIYGSILGDGSISKPYKNNSHMRIVHSINQKEWLHFKHSVFDKYYLANDIYIRNYKSDKYKSGEYTEIGFKTKTHPIFTSLRNKFYVNGKKSIDEFINNLNTLGLAIWYMDDGNVGQYGLFLNTQSFFTKEKNRAIKVLNEKWNLKATLHSQGQIYIWSESVPTFLLLIDEHIIPSMRYKTRPYSARGLE
jgi:hypothetical protein